MSNYLYYVRKRISGKAGMLALNVLVSSLALLLLCVAVIFPLILRHCEKTIRKALGNDISMYGVVRNDGDAIFNEAINDYSFDIYNAPEIDGVGTWDYLAFPHMTTVDGEADYWNEILKIQSSHIRPIDDQNTNWVQCVYMLSQAFPINDLKLYRGSAEQVGNNDGYLIYLGYNFRDIPLETKFVNEYGDSYVVAGILQKNSSIISSQLLWNLGGFRLSCSSSMDNLVLILPPCSQNYQSEAYFFKCSEGYTYEDAAKKIKSISEQYGIQTETGTLQDRVDDVLSDGSWILKAVARMSVLLFFSAFVILLTAQLLAIMFRKDEFGVWLISGVDRKKIAKILLGENLIKMLMSSLITLAIVILSEKVIIESRIVAYELRYILWIGIPVLLLACTVLMAFLCSVIPIAYIKKKSIPDIIRGTWD